MSDHAEHDSPPPPPATPLFEAWERGEILACVECGARAACPSFRCSWPEGDRKPLLEGPLCAACTDRLVPEAPA